MHTIKLKIDDRAYDKLIRHLGEFSKEEVEIIMDEPNFVETKKYLDAELDEINSGNAKFLTVNEAEQRLDEYLESTSRPLRYSVL
jgi:ethanolamine utilization microcompartment shell protein EutL